MNIFFDFHDKTYRGLMCAYSFGQEDIFESFYDSIIGEAWVSADLFDVCPELAWDIQIMLDLDM